MVADPRIVGKVDVGEELGMSDSSYMAKAFGTVHDYKLINRYDPRKKTPPENGLIQASSNDMWCLWLEDPTTTSIFKGAKAMIADSLMAILANYNLVITEYDPQRCGWLYAELLPESNKPIPAPRARLSNEVDKE
jgi:hypothetical protein